jgi:hypothetical protein
LNASLENYDELKKGGFSDEQARAISHVVGQKSNDARLSEIEKRLGEVERTLRDVVTKLGIGFTFMRWGVGLIFAMVAALIVQTFF